MTNNDLTLLGIVVDHSGSMRACQEDMEGGLNTLIEEQTKQPGECEITLAEFDDTYDLVWPIQSIKSVGKYSLRPAGMTALLDAMGEFICYVGDELRDRAESKRPGKVIIVVVTDGHENASHEWNATQIKKLVEEQKNQWQWEFLFLGANIDAVKEGGNIGMTRGAAMTFDAASPVAMASAYNATSGLISSYRSTGTMDPYSEDDRKKAMDKP